MWGFERKLLMTSARKCCPKWLKEKSYETFQSVQALSETKIEQGATEMQNRRVTWKLGTKKPSSIFSHNHSVCLQWNPSRGSRRPDHISQPDTCRNEPVMLATTPRHSGSFLRVSKENYSQNLQSFTKAILQDVVTGNFCDPIVEFATHTPQPGNDFCRVNTIIGLWWLLRTCI
jgi:hypothetical protein